jgi:UDP-N-acetylglucosamine--dolichyl-phosphate N-acetylglucosaminephosphotransferase
MNILLPLCVAFAFIITYASMPVWIRRARSIGLVGRDMHKPARPEVAEMGGICAVAGIVGSVFLYLALTTFYFGNTQQNSFILALLNTIIIAAMIGVMDDVLGWKKGLRQSSKFLLTIPAAIPMMVVNAGNSIVNFPVVGYVDTGIFYPLIIVPVGIIGASNAFNMIAGYNGLEAGMGAIILGALSYVAWTGGLGHVALIAAVGSAALIAFMKYNWVPARVFPGNVFTYAVGSLIACVAILGNSQKLALILFSLYFIEFILKARGRFKKESFGRCLKDGSIEMQYDRIYGIEHVMIKACRRLFGSCSESYVTTLILMLQILVSIIAIAIF